MRVKNLLFLAACLIFSLNVMAQDDYLRVTDLSQIQNGSSVIFAVRHDSLSVSSYYAMKKKNPEAAILHVINDYENV